MTRVFPLFALGAAALLCMQVSAEDSAPPPNPVQQEMRLLEAALQESVSAIARGDVRGLPKKLHAVHTAAGDTKTALQTGAYKPPRNADQVAAFVAMDEAFHAEMIKMVKAARKNDLDTTARQLGELMTRCHGCHAQFRDPPPALNKGAK